MRRNAMSELCKWVNTNVRPDSYNTHDNCKGDCTTRALTYCLAGELTYNQVEDEQYKRAEKVGKRRNRTGVYDTIMLERGWRWIQLSKPIARGEVAVRLAKKLPGVKAMTLSKTHIAAVDGGNLIDTWDSRGGRVFAVMVPGDKKTLDAAKWCLGWDNGIECEVLPRGKRPKNTGYKPRRSRYRGW